MTKAYRRRRTADEKIADLEARIAQLRGRIDDTRKFSPGALLKDRERLELTAADYARLVGVSTQTVYGWEHGRSKPRPAQVERCLAVREMGKREAYKKLGRKSPRAFSPDAVFSERERLELSARDYGELVGVSQLTIYNWEKGKTEPRSVQLEMLLAVRGIGKRKAWKQLGYE